ncbi:MAG TPA: glycosyl transferase, partial [Acetobacteraceae bacterium]|nr:glycosyl transferase [Acetobacteraceae bacterium]
MSQELEAARREIERLRALLEANRESALLQAGRADLMAEDVQRRAEQVETIRRSTSWRLTRPLRAAGRLPGMAKRAARVLARDGLAEAAHVFRREVRKFETPPKPGLDPAVRAFYRQRVAAPANAILAPRVLIIADLALAQCAKYRVWQKQAHLARLGVACTVLDRHELAACRSALQTHALVIFYRVPGTEEVLGLIEEAKRLNLPNYWEADDLIFDMSHYLANRNLETLDPALRDSVLVGVELFRAAMLACERTIASTAELAERMREAGAGPSLVIENALDAETLELA